MSEKSFGKRSQFDYCGLASIKDLHQSEWERRICELEAFNLGKIGSFTKGWSVHWSRIWEFPFAYTAIANYSHFARIFLRK